VRVSDDDVAHFGPLFCRQRDRDAARVNRYAVVDQKTSQALFKVCVTLSIKSAW